MAMSDCPKCWDTPCSCGHMGYNIVYGSCKDCYYAVNDATLCEMHTKMTEDGVCEFDITPDFFCASFKAKDKQ